MTHLIVACLFPFTGTWASTEYYVTGELIRDDGPTLVVDISHAAKELHIGGEDYYRFTISRDDCVIGKTAVQHNEERLKTYSASQLINKKRGQRLP